jgi:predicted metal-dependent phosphoesterase TrpH
VPLKAELHAHTSDDPEDAIGHTAAELIDRAADLGYHALAITLHDKQLDIEPLKAHATSRGVVLIRGVERTIRGRHVLLLNFSARAESINSFEELADLKRLEPGLVVAPHPFFPVGHCLGRLMDQYTEVFDAVELNAMYARGLNFNKAAIRWAARHGKPVVGNGDVHHLVQLGTTYSLVDAEADPLAICDAIRAGRVSVQTEALSWFRAVTIVGEIFAGPGSFIRHGI